MRAVVIAISMSACAAAPPSSPGVPVAPITASLDAGAWERLSHGLVGSWSMATSSGGELRVAYKVISNATAVVEDWGVGSAHETETVFYPDHRDILLTHYCAQGNQPRLRAVAASRDEITFKFLDVTNKSPDQAMLVERRLHFTGDQLVDTEIYRQPNGSDETTTYTFARAQP